MRSILLDLYRGNGAGFDGNYDSTPTYRAAAARHEALELQLRRTLPENQRAAFEEYTKVFHEMNDLCCEQDFIAGYRCGVQMMIAALPPTNSNS